MFGEVEHILSHVAIEQYVWKSPQIWKVGNYSIHLLDISMGQYIDNKTHHQPHHTHTPPPPFVLFWSVRITHLPLLQLMAFLIHGSNPFKCEPFHNFLNFWCNFPPIITVLFLIFIYQCTCNENIRPWLHFHRIKTVFNLMSLAVQQHCSRDVIRTNLSFLFWGYC